MNKVGGREEGKKAEGWEGILYTGAEMERFGVTFGH